MVDAVDSEKPLVTVKDYRRPRKFPSLKQTESSEEDEPSAHWKRLRVLLGLGGEEGLINCSYNRNLRRKLSYSALYYFLNYSRTFIMIYCSYNVIW